MLKKQIEKRKNNIRRAAITLSLAAFLLQIKAIDLETYFLSLP